MAESKGLAQAKSLHAAVESWEQVMDGQSAKRANRPSKGCGFEHSEAHLMTPSFLLSSPSQRSRLQDFSTGEAELLVILFAHDEPSKTIDDARVCIGVLCKLFASAATEGSAMRPSTAIVSGTSEFGWW